jgi:transcription elongation GreA/GreB family factor
VPRGLRVAGSCGYTPGMDKRNVVREIQAYLNEELASLESLNGAPSARPADAETQGRIRELRSQLTMYQFLPLREYGAEDVVCPASLVELELQPAARRAFYFIVPSGGGLVMRIDEQPVQVITPNSPLGEVLMGRRVGESVSVEAGGKPREYRIVSMR